MQQEGLSQWVAAADPLLGLDSELQGKLKDDGVRCYEDYVHMLDRELDLEAVVIATPIPLHFSMLQHCMRRGLNVLLEKPPIPLLGQLDRALQQEESSRVAVGFQHICSREVRALKRRICDGALGEIREIRAAACWSRDNAYYARAPWAGRMILGSEPVFDGPATNALSHVIHNIMHLASVDPKGFAVPSSIQGELYRARTIESYDVISLRGTFGNGTAFSVTLTHATRDYLPFQIEVTGTAGVAIIAEDGRSLHIAGEPVTEWAEAEPNASHALYRNFLGFCAGNLPRPATLLSDTRGYLLATNGALLSSGKIRDIPDEYLDITDNAPVHVKGLREAVLASFSKGLLLSELDIPWAVRTSPVDCSRMPHLDLATYSPACH